MRRKEEDMGYIQIPISDVWELVNKPWRFYTYLYNAVKKLKCGNYYLLKFNKECKDEVLDRIYKITYNK